MISLRPETIEAGGRISRPGQFSHGAPEASPGSACQERRRRFPWPGIGYPVRLAYPARRQSIGRGPRFRRRSAFPSSTSARRPPPRRPLRVVRWFTRILKAPRNRLRPEPTVPCAALLRDPLSFFAAINTIIAVPIRLYSNYYAFA